ncbi:MAG: Trm112 family protein [Actinomycetota bacterium]
MALSPQLLAILACPEDKGPLHLVDAGLNPGEPSGTVLYNPRLRRVYEVRDEIPIMLIDEATDLDDAAATRLDEVVREHAIAPTFEADG